MMKVNGQTVSGKAGQILLDYLEAAGYRTDRIAVELNGQIVPRAEYVSVRLQAEDSLEIVSFVGGG